MSDESEDSGCSVFEFLLFIVFSLLGVLGTYFEVGFLYSVLTSGSIDQLTFKFIKYDSGTVTYGYAALIQHLALLFVATLMLALAMNSFRKIINCMD